MSEDYDYSEYLEDGPGDNMLSQLSGLAQEQRQAEERVAELEEELRQAKAHLRDISEVKIPELMAQAGVSEFSTPDGMKIKVRDVIRASIPKAHQEQAFQWLEDHGYGNLIKREFNIQFGKDEEGWANKFEADLKKRKKQLNVKRKKTVHPNTLASFVREQLEEGEEIPLQLLGVQQQKQTKVEIS